MEQNEGALAREDKPRTKTHLVNWREQLELWVMILRVMYKIIFIFPHKKYDLHLLVIVMSLSSLSHFYLA